jgi:hypothetical protein
MRSLDIHIHEILVSAGLIATGCASADAGPDDPAQAPTAEATTASDGITTGDTASTPPAQPSAVSAPQLAYAGSSTAAVLASSASGAPGLAITGSPDEGAFLLARYLVTPSMTDATAEVTVTPHGDAAFLYMLTASGSGYATRQLRLERLPGSTALQAQIPTGTAVCGDVASDRPTSIALAFHSRSQTFDVLFDGAATACTGLPTRLVPPITGFELMDASNAGYGGQVEFTDLSVF